MMFWAFRARRDGRVPCRRTSETFTGHSGHPRGRSSACTAHSSLLWRPPSLDAASVEDARGGAVDVGHDRRLRAARCQRRSKSDPLGVRQQRSNELPDFHRWGEQRGAQPVFQGGPHHPLQDRPLHPFFDDVATDVQQLAVFGATWAGGLAVAAGQASVQVLLRALRDLAAFKHLIHEVDATPWAVEFISQQLIGCGTWHCRSHSART